MKEEIGGEETEGGIARGKMKEKATAFPFVFLLLSLILLILLILLYNTDISSSQKKNQIHSINTFIGNSHTYTEPAPTFLSHHTHSPHTIDTSAQTLACKCLCIPGVCVVFLPFPTLASSSTLLLRPSIIKMHPTYRPGVMTAGGCSRHL